MPFQTHDPYLNTVQRDIQEKYYKNRKQIIEKREGTSQKTTNFLSHKVYLSDFINLPEGTLNIVVFIAFVLIPYLTGIAFIFLLIAKANFDTFKNININDYLIYWTIGYELLAVLFILLIIKSAINFNNAISSHKNSY
ncbi:MAG: hypothetical protein DSZ11_01775 [Sulfurovum sp.]|nr:MAG: hypothetical protein DSZ11_01775 [Sulfurovum sp.]